jgi:serine/threonine-protein kinase
LVGSSHLILGPVLHRLGRYEEAMAEMERALQIAEAGLGPDHHQTSAARINLAVMVQAAGDAARAAELFQAGVVALRAEHGDAHIAVADAEDGLGRALKDLGRHEDARAHLTEALRIRRALLPPGSPRIGATLGNLAALRAEVGEHAAAADAFGEALGIFEATVGEAHPFYAFALSGRGEARARSGEVDEGIADLERALRLQATHGHEPKRLAEMRWALARVRWDTDGDRAQALDEARAARAELVAVEEAASALVARWDAWLAERAAMN